MINIKMKGLKEIVEFLKIKDRDPQFQQFRNFSTNNN